MKIIETKVLKGPNFWSIKRQKLIQFTIDLEDLEEKPTDTIPGFFERLQQMLPSLYDHECSRHRKGGFFERVKEGTWMGHVIEHVAIELQILAGISVSFGRARGTGRKGVYQVVFEYDEEAEGIYAGKAAKRVVECIIKLETVDICAEVNEIRNLWYRDKPGPSTASIINEAKSRNIPVMRLDDNAMVQLGYGSKQQRIEASLTCNTSAIAVDLACNKAATKTLLSEAYIPTPSGNVILSIDQLVEVIGDIGYPIVIKPLNGNHGRGASVNIRCWEDAEVAYYKAKDVSEKLLVEKFISGNDYRILVVDYRFVAAAQRKPASVKGDGYHTIQELIHLVNKDPRRGVEHENVLTTIKVDECTLNLLRKKNYTLDSILPEGRELLLKPTANLSTGGTATDVTEEVHPEKYCAFPTGCKSDRP